MTIPNKLAILSFHKQNVKFSIVDRLELEIYTNVIYHPCSIEVNVSRGKKKGRSS